MEAPMKRVHFIGLDTHCQFCEMAAIDADGKLFTRERCATTIPALVKLLESVPRPCHVVIEESSLADWLYRNLLSQVDTLTVCEPRRNRLIAEEGDKDDDVDAEKLAQLLRGGYVKAVHHSESLAQSLFKQHVNLYHDRVRKRVREAHGISGLLKRHGVMARERHFVNPEKRPALLEKVPGGILHEDLQSLWQSYDQMVEMEERFRRRLVSVARQLDVTKRMEALPGVGWIRAATLYAYLDTPWRFRSKEALWKYLGIGLERRHSGNGPMRLKVPRNVNRLLKSTILGAAKSAVLQGENPFADLARRWTKQGLAPRMVRRNVARSISATLWGLWKNGSEYRPEWVGVAAAAKPGIKESC
jgi:transposase